MAPAETCERSTCSKCLTGVGGGGVMGDGARDERRDEGRRENGASRGREQPWLSTPFCLTFVKTTGSAYAQTCRRDQ